MLWFCHSLKVWETAVEVAIVIAHIWNALWRLPCSFIREMGMERKRNKIKQKSPTKTNNFPCPPTGCINYLFNNSSGTLDEWKGIEHIFFLFLVRQTEYPYLGCSVSILGSSCNGNPQCSENVSLVKSNQIRMNLYFFKAWKHLWSRSKNVYSNQSCYIKFAL